MKKYNEEEAKALDPDLMFCSSESGSRDQCQGDSGSAWITVDRPFKGVATSKWVLIGLTSWGLGCAETNGVGARINEGVLDWILKITNSTATV